MTMRMGAFSFAPGLVTTIAAAAFIALLLSLGRWQVNRGHEKEALQALLEARMHETPVRLAGPLPSAAPLLFRRVEASGRWIAERQIFVDNQVRDGRAGFHVITPLRIEGTKDVVLVNRGWIARDASYPRAPRVAAPEGRVEVAGMASLPPARYLELSGETVTGEVWQNLSLERYRALTGLAILPVVILDRTPAPGLAAVQAAPDAGVAKHREYALTWFALAATTLGLWIVLNLRRAP
jgi:surfeit locus 1 family protein